MLLKCQCSKREGMQKLRSLQKKKCSQWQQQAAKILLLHCKRSTMASDSIAVAKATAVITEGSPIAVRMAATADRIIVADRTIAAALVAN